MFSMFAWLHFKLRTWLRATKILFIFCHISSHSLYLTSKTQGMSEVLKDAEVATPSQYSPLPNPPISSSIHLSIYQSISIYSSIYSINVYLGHVGYRNEANINLAFHGTYGMT